MRTTISNRGFGSRSNPRAAAIAKFDFAYALTVHKAQGSEWPYVLVIDESFCWKARKGQEDKGEEHKWLYTAVTRAQRKVVVVRLPWRAK